MLQSHEIYSTGQTKTSNKVQKCELSDRVQLWFKHLSVCRCCVYLNANAVNSGSPHFIQSFLTKTVTEKKKSVLQFRMCKKDKRATPTHPHTQTRACEGGKFDLYRHHHHHHYLSFIFFYFCIHKSFTLSLFIHSSHLSFFPLNLFSLTFS